MIRVVVGGATGKMGSTICRLIAEQNDIELQGAVVSSAGGNVGRRIAGGVVTVGEDKLDAVLEGADVYVDVTTPAGAEKNLLKAPIAGVNSIIGTTSITVEALTKFADAVRRHQVSAVVTPNFSIGVNVFWKTCEDLAMVLRDYDVEILEVHHGQKKDAPSGTALRAAEIIARATGVEKIVRGRDGIIGARGKEIGIHSIRAGDVVGEHTVIFAGKRERLELTHRAHSRDAFAEGCLAAIRWIWQRKDGRIYTMREVLGL
ncbi:MAG: 4-hydroxy-tetrahydrodipicolinate reductase [Euryarchaeota archaeon]|nr:4-hydroxy-tetrahydrodipicolinate reductase [Euryarchaeota archaeon]